MRVSVFIGVIAALAVLLVFGWLGSAGSAAAQERKHRNTVGDDCLTPSSIFTVFDLREQMLYNVL